MRSFWPYSPDGERLSAAGCLLVGTTLVLTVVSGAGLLAWSRAVFPEPPLLVRLAGGLVLASGFWKLGAALLAGRGYPVWLPEVCPPQVPHPPAVASRLPRGLGKVGVGVILTCACVVGDYYSRGGGFKFGALAVAPLALGVIGCVEFLTDRPYPEQGPATGEISPRVGALLVVTKFLYIGLFFAIVVGDVSAPIVGLLVAAGASQLLMVGIVAVRSRRREGAE